MYATTPVCVDLVDAEQRLARYLAVQRHDRNRAAGVENQRRGPQSDEATDLNGVGAELAFCRLFNLYPDLTLEPRTGGADALLAGATVDVKTTVYDAGRLIAQLASADHPCELYALMIGTFPCYRFAGFATGAALLARANLFQFPNSSEPCYALPQSALVRRS